MTRVGVVGPLFPDSFADNIVSSLHLMGHEVVCLGSASRLPMNPLLSRAAQIGAQASQLIERKLQHKVVAAARQARPDLIISVDAGLLPQTVVELQISAARVVLWFPDALSNLGRQLMFMAPYDLVCFKDPALVERSRRMLDIRVHYLPEACNPAWHRPPDHAAWEPIIVVAGNMYPARVRLLERLAGAGLPLRLYGPPAPRWMRSEVVESCHTGKYIARENKAAVFRSAAVVLNTLHPTEMESLNCRLFEAAGCGAAVLTEDRQELSKFFDVGEEVAVFATFDELVAEATRLLSDCRRSRDMGNRAAQRAHRDHSYAVRLMELMGEVPR